MQALFLVLHKVECLEDILTSLQKEGIQGGTIINSTGMISTLQGFGHHIIDSFISLLDTPKDESRLLFFILDNKTLEVAKKCINQIVGGIENPNTGIMFGIDLSFVEGVTKNIS